MQYRVSPQALGDMSAEQWQARVDLAAAHRLAFMHGFSEGIFNHLTDKESQTKINNSANDDKKERKNESEFYERLPALVAVERTEMPHNSSRMQYVGK